MKQSINVLMVDDDSLFLELSEKYFQHINPKEFHLNTIFATDVTTACTFLDSKSIDVIVSDYQMAPKSGIDLLRHIRHTNKHIPFILFTGKGKEEVAIEALNEGADFYLEKTGVPKVMFRELVHIIEKLYKEKKIQNDLTESKKQLELKEQRFTAIVANISDLITILDRQGNVIYDNPAIYETLGYTQKERVGRDSTTMFHPKDRDRVLEVFQRVLETPNKTFMVSYQYKTKLGSYRKLVSKVKNLLHLEAINGILITSYDVTDWSMD